MRALPAFRTLHRLCVAVLACYLLAGCRSDFHLLLFNNTDDPIVVSQRAQDPTPLRVQAGVTGDITGASTDEFSIERNGTVKHYLLPVAFTFPSGLTAGYERRVHNVGKTFYFQLGADDRIYILRQHEPLEASAHSAQPPGFPLVPH